MIGPGNICELLYYSCPGKPLGLNSEGRNFFSVTNQWLNFFGQTAFSAKF